MPHRKKKRKTIYKICDDGYHVSTEALKSCKHTHGEERPVLANNCDNGKKSWSPCGQSSRRDITCSQGMYGKTMRRGVSVAYGTGHGK